MSGMVTVTGVKQAFCPCCSDPMDWTAVVCWTCYRWTERLTPGVYQDQGYPSTIDARMIANWDAARVARLGS